MTDTPKPTAEDTMKKVRELLERSVNYELGNGEYPSFIRDLERTFPEIASLCESQAKRIEENRNLKGALIDLQQEHCDTHCGYGQHVSICENASKALSTSLSISNPQTPLDKGIKIENPQDRHDPRKTLCLYCPDCKCYMRADYYLENHRWTRCENGTPPSFPTPSHE